MFGNSCNGIFALGAAACGLAAGITAGIAAGILKLAEATGVLAAGYLAGGRRRNG